MSYPPEHFVTRLEGAPCPCRECIHKTCLYGHTCSELMEAERAWHMWEAECHGVERQLGEALARAAWAENLLAAALNEDNSGEFIDWRPDAEAVLASRTEVG